MQKFKISRRKLEELEFQCLQNAIRLHFDSILLLREKSFASAFALSVIASEEFGKGFAIDEILFQYNPKEGFGEWDEKFMRQLLSDHKLKQGWFVSSFFDRFSPKAIFKKYQRIQTDKNNAIYVGVKEGNHHVIRPFLVSKFKAKLQIRTINDALIKFIERRLAESDFDTDGWDYVLRRRGLLNRLKKDSRIFK
jgi:AbiV family abortive infection protein